MSMSRFGVFANHLAQNLVLSATYAGMTLSVKRLVEKHDDAQRMEKPTPHLNEPIPVEDSISIPQPSCWNRKMMSHSF